LKADWDLQTQTAMAGGSTTLSMTRRRFAMFISPASVQDGNFPGNT
jgi:hypothetical protein